MLALLTQGSSIADSPETGQSALVPLVKDLPAPDFIQLLEQITQEFEQSRQAIEMINDDALERVLDQLLEAFTLKIGQILHADRTTIFLVDEEQDQLWSKVASGKDGQREEIRIPRTAGIAGHVAATGEVLNIPDAYSHPMFNPEVDKNTGYRTRNILCMPIVDAQKRVVAVAQLLNKKGDRPFSASDQSQFQEFATAIGVILESCNALYMASRNQRGATALLNATAFLGQSLDLERTLQSVMNEARKLMQADRSTLFLLDREKGELWSRIAKADGKTTIDIRIPSNRGIAGFVASTGESLNITNAYEDPRFDPTVDRATGYLTRTVLCMPVFNSEEHLIGVTQLINKHQGTFNRSDEEFMQAFNIQAGIALENAQLFERVLLERQYQKDILQSLSDAVISTDMDGCIVTINDAALGLLGCPLQRDDGAQQRHWIRQLSGRRVWEVVPIDNLKMRLQDSLQFGTRQYVPEQSLTFGVSSIEHLQQEPTKPEALDTDEPLGSAHEMNVQPSEAAPLIKTGVEESLTTVLVVRSPAHPQRYLPWNLVEETQGWIAAVHVQPIERSINLTVNPLTNPDGKVQGGLVVLEDISQEKRMKATMYRYMTPGVADRVMALGEDALMVGERKDVTILFSDIRGYTSLTEDMEAADVVTLLNDYFETMVEAVFNFEGTLDKFIGDALMAVFGAPLPLNNHAEMAVKSALDMRRRLSVFNEYRNRQNQPLIRFGIGISSGEVVSGNIGSQKRMDYTVIGNGVDISSRLEGVTKQYGCDIILSEYTYQLCKDTVWVRELDRIRVKGKTKPISIYQLIDARQTPLNDRTQELLSLYHQGRAAYTRADFRTAKQWFERAQHVDAEDQAIAVHLQRIDEYLKNPPPPNWDGVHTMTTK
jgi:adenylate cyclase